MSFIARHGLWTEEQQRSAAQCLRDIKAQGIESVRIGFPDLHGIVRGKVVMAAALAGVFENGLPITSSLLLKDTSHRTVTRVFTPGGGIDIDGFEGAADIVLVPDPETFRILPWATSTAWLLCDCYFTNGQPVPIAPRQLLRQQVVAMAQQDLELITGLEIEFHLFRLDDRMLGLADSGQPGQPPAVTLTHQGYNYLTELRYDGLEPILDVLRATCQSLKLALSSMEIEFGPSQVEFVFDASTAMRAADDMVLFRTAIKQVAWRHGYHATFMCRPAIPNVCSSGWHLHQSLRRISDGSNLFAGSAAARELSPLGMQYLAGLMRDAPAAMPFSTPTINGYKRIRPLSLAPDRVAWGVDNRGAMLRVLPGSGKSARIENRIGEPAANPYLYMASQAASGLAGIADRLDPGPCSDTPYEADAPALPTTLSDAINALDHHDRLRCSLGDIFIDHYIKVKRAEIARFNAEVTVWEQREYFELF